MYRKPTNYFVVPRVTLLTGYIIIIHMNYVNFYVWGRNGEREKVLGFVPRLLLTYLQGKEVGPVGESLNGEYIWRKKIRFFTVSLAN